MSRRIFVKTQTRKQFQKQSALSIAKQNKRVLAQRKPEQMVWRVDPVLITTVTAGAVYLLTGITQGDTQLDRSGLKIRVKRINFIFRAFADIASRAIRIILFKDTAQHGVAPVTADILMGAGYSDFTDSVTSRKRFSILMDRQIHLSATAAEKDSYAKISYNKRVNFPIYYIGDSAAASSMGKNTLYALIISENAGTANKCSYQVMVDFEDN